RKSRPSVLSSVHLGIPAYLDHSTGRSPASGGTRAGHGQQEKNMRLSRCSILGSLARSHQTLSNSHERYRWGAAVGLMLVLACSAPSRAASPTPFFDNGAPDGKMAMASRPASSGKVEIETGDDFILSVNTAINSVTFTGLLTGASPTIGQLRVEI